MRLALTATIFFLSTVALAGEGTSIARTRDGALRVELLPPAIDQELNGCGCAFFPAGAKPGDDRAITGWTEGGEGKAPLQINGTTERLALTSERDHREDSRDGPPRVGDKMSFSLANDRTRVVLSCKVSQTCWGEPRCEVIQYSCSADIRAKGRKLLVPAAGECGC